MAKCFLFKSTITARSPRGYCVLRCLTMVTLVLLATSVFTSRVMAQGSSGAAAPQPSGGSVAKLKFESTQPPQPAAPAKSSGVEPVASAMPARDTNTATLKLDPNANRLPSGSANPDNEFDQEFVRIGYWQSGGLMLRDRDQSEIDSTSGKIAPGSDPGFNQPINTQTSLKQDSPGTLQQVPPRDAATSKTLSESTNEQTVLDRRSPTPAGTAIPANDKQPRQTGSAIPTPNPSSTRLLLSDESLIASPRHAGNQFRMDDQSPPSPPSGTSLTDPKLKFFGASFFKNQEPESLPTPPALPNSAVDPRYSIDPNAPNPLLMSDADFQAGGDRYRSNSDCGQGICSPLFYSTLWVGHSDLDTLQDDAWDPTQTNGRFHMSTGASAGMALGIYHGNNLRSEFEVAARSNNLDFFEVSRPVGIPAQQNFPLDGKLRTYSGMSNLYWDFGRTSNRRFRPYVGAGVGFAFLDADFENFGRSVMVNGFERDSSFAFQWMAGVNAAITRELEMFVEYRFFGTDDLRLGTQFSRFGAQAGDPDQIFGDYDYRSQNILMGLRVKF